MTHHVVLIYGMKTIDLEVGVVDVRVWGSNAHPTQKAHLGGPVIILFTGFVL